MFLLNEKPLALDTPFIDADGNQYPANWLRLSSSEEKEAIGITEVVDKVRADDRFYWDGDVSNPKDLTQLKAQFTTQINQVANSLLATTDWMIIRKAERNVNVPDSVATYRMDVIDESNRVVTAIDSATTVEELIEVLNTQQWPEVK